MGTADLSAPGRTLKLVSWNVNGLRAALDKGLRESLARLDADVVALQETKLQPSRLDPARVAFPGYTACWSHCTVKKGYSGVALFTRVEPREVRTGIGEPRFDAEGRIIEADLGPFVLFNVYFPNGQASAERLQYKLDFYAAFFRYADGLRRAGRRLVVCGDFNTAHHEIDLANPRANENSSGFLRIERDWLDRITADGYVDAFRHRHPEAVRYSWWSYRFKARERNIGWRIDYFFVTRELIEEDRIREAFIDNDVYGSDHCPVGLVVAV